jgi:hypothetical protein
MAVSRLPIEVELIYELMPCNAERVANEPIGPPHPCSYFRKWGTYHSYDYTLDGPPPAPGVIQEATYVGRAPLVPEALSGCRKSPIMAVGINPNLPAWYQRHRRTVFPLFDDYRQYAHYFRYRSIDKVELAADDYRAYGGDDKDTPFTTNALNVPLDADGRRSIRLQPAPQSMYEAYQGLLDDLARAMGWPKEALKVGEDLAYGNMVASASARWTTEPIADDPALPPMTAEEREGIVAECFTRRRYFPRQLFQSLPAIVLIFSQATANAFIAEFHERFIVGDPHPGESLRDLARRPIRLRFGTTDDGTPIDARTIFAPHATGNPTEFARERARVIAALAEEAKSGAIRFNASTRHLERTVGGCVLCPMLEIGPCDYSAELRPLTNAPRLTADSPVEDLVDEKRRQLALLGPTRDRPAPGWSLSDDDGPRDG